MNALLTAVRDFARRNLHLFPLHYIIDRHGQPCCSCGNQQCGSNAGKHPYPRLAPRGLLNATTDVATLTRWWGADVPYNIGIRTGATSGIVVVDVDPRHGGDATLVALEQRFGSLPDTWRAITGGGGEHIYFRHPGVMVRNDVGTKLGVGLDIRGDGGYVAAPPSRHMSGRHYAWSVDHHPDGVALAEIPEWLLQMLAAPTKQKHVAVLPESWRALVSEGVVEGRRNIAVTRLSGHLLRHHVDPFVVLDLVRCWNALRCRPPLSDAEIERTVNSICGLELARRRRSDAGR